MDFYNTIYNLVLFTPVLVFVHYGGFDFLKNLFYSTKTKVNKMVELKKQLNDKNISVTKIFTVAFMTVYSIVYYTLIQRLYKAVHKVNKHTFEVTYCLSGKIYKFHVKPKRGVHTVLQVIDHEDNDVTDEVEPYIGPAEDFHQFQYTPNTFGYKSLTFNCFDGSVKKFEEYEKLTL